MIQKGKKAQAWRAVMKHGVGTKSLETRVVGKPITSSWVAEFMLEMPTLYDVLLGLDFSALIAAQAVCTAWRDGVKYHSLLWKVVCGRIGVRADSRAAFVRRLRACGRSTFFFPNRSARVGLLPRRDTETSPTRGANTWYKWKG